MNMFEYTKSLRREVKHGWEKYEAYMQGFSDALKSKEEREKLKIMRDIRNSLRKS